MNREFKFRAWCKEHKVMVDKIDFVKWNEKRELFVNQDHRCAGEEILLQYTGIHDNTDEEKEIYEGDKIKFIYEGYEYTGEVKFEVGTFIIGCNELPDSYVALIEIINLDRGYWWINGEVIGNIYEN